MTNSRAKGARGELDLVKLYERHGFEARRTASMQSADDDHFPDVTAADSSSGALLIANECKFRKTMPSKALRDAIAQSDAAYAGSESVLRVVAMRQHGKPDEWIFAMRQEAFFVLLKRGSNT